MLMIDICFYPATTCACGHVDVVYIVSILNIILAQLFRVYLEHFLVCLEKFIVYLVSVPCVSGEVHRICCFSSLCVWRSSSYILFQFLVCLEKFIVYLVSVPCVSGDVHRVSCFSSLCVWRSSSYILFQFLVCLETFIVYLVSVPCVSGEVHRISCFSSLCVWNSSVYTSRSYFRLPMASSCAGIYCKFDDLQYRDVTWFLVIKIQSA